MESAAASPPLWKWLLSFILVGAAWGFTTPFMRRAALARDNAAANASKTDTARSDASQAKSSSSWLARRISGVIDSIADLLRNPAYTIPFLLNITGSVWFFLLIGEAELSLTVPIVNSLAFLFTVLGEWIAEGRVISTDTWMGMTLVLAGIALCVYSKTSSA